MLCIYSSGIGTSSFSLTSMNGCYMWTSAYCSMRDYCINEHGRTCDVSVRCLLLIAKHEVAISILDHRKKNIIIIIIIIIVFIAALW